MHTRLLPSDVDGGAYSMLCSCKWGSALALNDSEQVVQTYPPSMQMKSHLKRETLTPHGYQGAAGQPPFSILTLRAHQLESTLLVSKVLKEPPMIGGDIQPEDPNSLYQLLQFNENGICSADGGRSMDYWDPYGLDEGLLDHIATDVAHLRVGATHDGIAGFPQDPATHTTPPGILAGPTLDMATHTTPPGILSPVPLSSAPPGVWADLDTLDRLICK
uniref:Uncharacterized protein n=1 Tax=Timema shepardi TaxID=629360 RepID=A0A7R9B183_TIMSH|nr:unnamed protein product [Timema shepardi]